MDELINNLRLAFQQGIDELDWMTDVTKQAPGQTGQDLLPDRLS